MRISDWSSDVCSSDLIGRFDPAIDFPEFGGAVDLDAEMLDSGARVITHRNREIDARIFKHPLGIILLEDGRFGPEHGAVETDRGCEILDPDMAMRSDEHTSELHTQIQILHAVLRIQNKQL